jgi:hypothetical protein
MRYLIGLCALLVLANVSVYIWPTADQSLGDVYAAQGDINPNFIRLNKEIELAYQEKRLSKASTPALQESGSLTDAQAQSSDQVDNCFRLGPFLHRENFELAKAVLFNASVDYNSSKRVSKESRVYRVYLGEFDNRESVLEAKANLKRLNVLDHFVRKLDDERYLISLGIYTTIESAQSAALILQDKLDSVKVKDEQVVLPDSFWLHFALAEDGVIFRQLSQIDWGEQSAKLGRFSCELAEK